MVHSPLFKKLLICLKKKICQFPWDCIRISEFPKNTQAKDGLRFQCRKCTRVAVQEYNKKRKEREPDYLSKRYARQKLSNPYAVWALNVIGGHKRNGYNVLFNSVALATYAKTITNCEYCSQELNWQNLSKITNATPSLDRIDNEQNIDLQHVQIVCYECNRSKSNRTLEEFRQYCRNIYGKFS